MINGAVTNRYTQGLYEAAAAGQVVDQVDASLRLVAETIESNPELRTVLAHPVVTGAEKVELLNKVFGDKLDSFTSRFLQVLFTRKRGNYVGAIYERFHELAESAKGKITVQVESAEPLTEAQVKELEKTLSAALHKTAQAEITVSKDLLAGFRVQVGNRVLDATLRGKLDQFKHQLQSAGR